LLQEKEEEEASAERQRRAKERMAEEERVRQTNVPVDDSGHIGASSPMHLLLAAATP